MFAHAVTRSLCRITFSARRGETTNNNTLSPHKHVRKTVSSRSSNGGGDERRSAAKEPQQRTTKPLKVIKHPNEVVANGEVETRFETILEISPNEAIHHFVSGMPEKPVPVVSDNLIGVEETRSSEGLLRQERLCEEEEDEEEEDTYRYQRILDWLEGVRTGDDAEQCVHDVIDDAETTASPEFARANAIVVVYDETTTAKTPATGERT